MRNFTGSFGAALVAVASGAAIALSAAPPSLAANQALMINGIAGGIPLGEVKAAILGGAFASYDRTEVPWPQQANPTTGKDSLFLAESIAQGADNLDAAIATALTKIGAGEHVTVVGLSAGALVADEELRRLLEDPDAPDKSKLNFVVVADSSRSSFNANRYDNILKYQYALPAETKYDTIVVVAEYDGFADFPDRVWNIVAVVNAFAGEILKHVPSVFTDLSTVPEGNITTTTNSLGGVTTRYFVPAEHLPIVELLPFLEPQEADLRKIIDSAYKRHDADPAAAVSAAATAAPAPVVPASAAAASAGDPPVVSPPVEPVATPEPEPEPEPASVPEPTEPAAPLGRTHTPEPVSTPAAPTESAGADDSAPTTSSSRAGSHRSASSGNSARSGGSKSGANAAKSSSRGR